jgi:transposase
MLMAKPILEDNLWNLIEPLLPAPKPRRFRHPGRKPISHRQALTGILFVLKTGIPWEDLPQELGCGSGMTCWRRLHDWQAAGVWQRIHEALLAQLREADQLDWSRAVVDSSAVRALKGGKKPDPIPPTKPKRAANTRSLRMRKAFPWRLS